jgi:arabinogalactan oligomer/maltooligosaccharide transport system substrate-binding protein
MKNKKLLFLASTLIFSAGALVSCGGTTSGGTTSEGTTSEGTTSEGTTSEIDRTKSLVIWSSSEDIQDGGFMDQAIAAFKAAYPTDSAGIDFVTTAVGEGDAATQVKNDPDASADVFHFAGDQLGSLVQGGYLATIPTALTTNLGIEEAVLEAGQVSGNQYGIPFTPNTFFLFYDASVYDADDVTSFTKMMAKDIGDYKYALSLDVANGWYLQSYFFSAGCTIYGEDGTDMSKGIEPTATGLKVAEWIWNYYNGANASKLYNTDGSANIGVDTAAGVTGTWNASTIKKNIEAAGGVYAAAPLPAVDFNGDGTEEAWQSVGDYKQIGVNKVTKHATLATKFATFLAGSEMQQLRYTLRATAPTNAEAAASDTIKNDIAVVAQTAQLAHTFNQPSVYASAGYWDKASAFGADIKASSEGEIEDYFDSFNNALVANAE